MAERFSPLVRKLGAEIYRDNQPMLPEDAGGAYLQSAARVARCSIATAMIFEQELEEFERLAEHGPLPEETEA